MTTIEHPTGSVRPMPELTRTGIRRGKVVRIQVYEEQDGTRWECISDDVSLEWKRVEERFGQLTEQLATIARQAVYGSPIRYGYQRILEELVDRGYLISSILGYRLTDEGGEWLAAHDAIAAAREAGKVCRNCVAVIQLGPIDAAILCPNRRCHDCCNRYCRMEEQRFTRLD